MKKTAILLGFTLTLAACETTTTATSGTAAVASRNVPDSVLAMAGPGQDLSTVVLQDDGCFWYRHSGPVETTMLPLRATNGRTICASFEETA